MLTTDDKKFIESSIAGAFQDFYDNIFEPFATRNAREHREFINEIKAMKRDIQDLKGETGEIKEYIKDHDKRIRKVELISGAAK